MHEQSEAIQDAPGKWVNIFGKGTKQAGQPLPPIHDLERETYDTVDEAVSAAKRRSELEGQRQDERRRIQKGKRF